MPEEKNQDIPIAKLGKTQAFPALFNENGGGSTCFHHIHTNINEVEGLVDSGKHTCAPTGLRARQPPGSFRSQEPDIRLALLGYPVVPSGAVCRMLRARMGFAQSAPSAKPDVYGTVSGAEVKTQIVWHYGEDGNFAGRERPRHRIRNQVAGRFGMSATCHSSHGPSVKAV
jgi:hypothetical protein